MGTRKFGDGVMNVIHRYSDCGGNLLELIKLCASDGCSLLFRNYIPFKLLLKTEGGFLLLAKIKKETLDLPSCVKQLKN